MKSANRLEGNATTKTTKETNLHEGSKSLRSPSCNLVSFVVQALDVRSVRLLQAQAAIPEYSRTSDAPRWLSPESRIARDQRPVPPARAPPLATTRSRRA